MNRIHFMIRLICLLLPCVAFPEGISNVRMFFQANEDGSFKLKINGEAMNAKSVRFDDLEKKLKPRPDATAFVLLESEHIHHPSLKKLLREGKEKGILFFIFPIEERSIIDLISLCLYIPDEKEPRNVAKMAFYLGEEFLGYGEQGVTAFLHQVPEKRTIAWLGDSSYFQGGGNPVFPDPLDFLNAEEATRIRSLMEKKKLKIILYPIWYSQHHKWHR